MFLQLSDGKSEVLTFRLADSCNAPINILGPLPLNVITDARNQYVIIDFGLKFGKQI